MGAEGGDLGDTRRSPGTQQALPSHRVQPRRSEDVPVTGGHTTKATTPPCGFTDVTVKSSATQDVIFLRCEHGSDQKESRRHREAGKETGELCPNVCERLEKTGRRCPTGSHPGTADTWGWMVLGGVL